MSAHPIGEPTLVESSTCAFCKGNYLLRGQKYVNLIRCESSLNIKMHDPKNGYGIQRTCFSIVPLDECIKVCFPCWMNERDRELERYALAPFAGYITQERTIG